MAGDPKNDLRILRIVGKQKRDHLVFAAGFTAVMRRFAAFSHTTLPLFIHESKLSKNGFIQRGIVRSMFYGICVAQREKSSLLRMTLLYVSGPGISFSLPAPTKRGGRCDTATPDFSCYSISSSLIRTISPWITEIVTRSPIWYFSQISSGRDTEYFSSSVSKFMM